MNVNENECVSEYENESGNDCENEYVNEDRYWDRQLSVNEIEIEIENTKVCGCERGSVGCRTDVLVLVLVLFLLHFHFHCHI